MVGAFRGILLLCLSRSIESCAWSPHLFVQGLSCMLLLRSPLSYIICLSTELYTNGEHWTQAASFMKLGTSMGIQGFLFLLHYKLEDMVSLLARTTFQALGRNHTWNRRESDWQVNRSGDTERKVMQEGNWEGREGEEGVGEREKEGEENTMRGWWEWWRSRWAWQHLCISCDSIHIYLQTSPIMEANNHLSCLSLTSVSIAYNQKSQLIQTSMIFNRKSITIYYYY